jgi:hypothetical protein
MKKVLQLLPVCILLFAACNPSKITSSYKPQSPDQKEFYKVLVLGLGKDSDLQLQAKMENHLAGDLRQLGYTAITSLEEYGPRAFKDLTEEQALIKLKNSNVDAIITIVLLNKKVEKQFVPTHERWASELQYRNLFWDYYGAMNNRVFEPGYYFDNTEYYWESNLFEMKKRSLVYSVKTTSFNPNNTEALAHQYGKMIVKNMKRNRVITRDTQPAKKGF